MLLNNLKGKYVYRSMQGLACLVIFTILLLLTMIAVFATPWKLAGDPHAKQGMIDLSGYDWNTKKVAYLGGEWESFPGVYLDGEKTDPSMLTIGKPQTFPLGNLEKASGTATYRLKLKLDATAFTKPLAVYISNLRLPTSVYLNGVKLSNMQGENPDEHSVLCGIYLVEDALDPAAKEQELILTVQEDQTDAALYKRDILVGGQQDILSHMNMVTADQMLALGVMLIIMINGFVFMIFRPHHVMISLITIFDTLMMLRILFGLNGMFSFFEVFRPMFLVTERFAVSASICFLMLGGAVGARLSHVLFDPEHKVPKWLTKPPIYIYTFLAVFFPLFPAAFARYGFVILLVVYVWTFTGVFWQFLICLRKNATPYWWLQVIKTAYVGVIVLYDILTINHNTDVMRLVYLYGIFFITHVILRLYDNNNSYRDVEILNQTLESTVIERTKELSEANRILSEMSVRDPLTKAYNRIYLERLLEELLQGAEEDRAKLFLTILDLDHFKSINDRFGHAAGDEQLRFAVNQMQSMIDEDTILARVGGEEFVLLFKRSDVSSVVNKLEEVRLEMEKRAQANEQYTTASFGLTGYHSGDSMKTLMGRADRSLYKAKNNGRNQIVSDLFPAQAKGKGKPSREDGIDKAGKNL